MTPHANLRGALQYLFREVFGVPCEGVTVESGDRYMTTLRGAGGGLVIQGQATSELAAYLRCIHHLTQLLEIPAGSATICNSRDWDNGSWVVLSRPLSNQPQGYSYFVTLRYVKAQQEYLRLTGVHADPDPAYLPNMAPLKP